MNAQRPDAAADAMISPTLVRAAIDLLEDVENGDPRDLDRIRRRCEALVQGMGVEFIEREGLFSPLDQRVVETVQTTLPELDGIVAASLRRGYKHLGRIERPQLVVAYKFSHPRNGGID
ncbi:MAG TPA: hypothetical protein PKY05_09890 [Fibrobacteria bacterium]|nr:hypothetical protein [Fibrobacteria bacterium]